MSAAPAREARIHCPRSLEEAVAALGSDPGAQLLAGGTDFMVEVNYGHRRPPSIVSLRDVPELAGWRREGADVVIGARCNYTTMEGPDLVDLVPALAQAARTVGSPQIRNAGTLGGNIGTASPAGDALPVLAALDARITVAGPGGSRQATLDEVVVGPKRLALGPAEVLHEVRLPAALGTQEFLKVGTRNAMVIAVASVALVVDWAGRTVRCALGSVGPTVLRAGDAEEAAAAAMDWPARTLARADATLDEFAALVRQAARPIDDHRSTAAYRRHAVGICARRALERALAHGAESLREVERWQS